MKKHNEKKYFEDWYLRILSIDKKQELICIIRIKSTNESGILQIIYNIEDKRKQIEISIDEFTSKKTAILFGNNSIGQNEILLELLNQGLVVQGRIELKNTVDLNQSFLMPGLMGIYKHIPFLEFYQEILTLHSEITGVMTINGENIDFTGGSCYLQKRWGTKFPNIWVWSQCTGFKKNKDLTVSIGVARLKVIFNYYTAFAIPVYYNGQVEVFSNYNGGHIAKLYRYKGYIHLIVIQKDKMLDLKIYGRDESKCILESETHGIRDVYACDGVKVEIKISHKGKVLLEDVSLYGNIEMGGNTSKLK